MEAQLPPEVLSTAEAAELCGLKRVSFRSAMHRARKQGLDLRVPGPDARTPQWDGQRLRAWMDSRPGRGNWNRDEADDR